MIFSFLYKVCFLISLSFVLFSGLIEPSFAQESQETTKENYIFETKLRASDAATVISGKVRIHLWGVEAVDGMSAQFKARARVILDNALGDRKAQCEIKERHEGEILAQCANASDLDLGLFMLQQGYVTADRGSVYGTVFEDAYIQAETEAQKRGVGVWKVSEKSGDSVGGTGGLIFLSLGIVLFLCILVAFIVLSLIIMRGFQRVSDAQNRNVDMISKERNLRNKERGIVAMMLDSELKANKAKIEAYLVVYDEMLRALEDPERIPKYKKAGDIVQKQPALDRVVFDRNTDKLDILGDRLSSQIIHFYARIKSNPDYINIEPDMSLEQVISIVKKAIDRAGRMNKIVERLLNLFSEGGLASLDMEDTE